MNLNYATLMKALSLRFSAKAVRGFDRSILLIIAASWMITIIVMSFAVYTLNLTAAAKQDVAAALAGEPALPQIVRAPVTGKEPQAIIDRLQRRYPEVNMTWQNNVLTVNGVNGAVYQQWLNAIGQLDTLYPQYHWKIKSMCVGKICNGANIMSVDLVAEKIAIQPPASTDK